MGRDTGHPRQLAEDSAISCVLRDAEKCADVFNVLLPEMFEDTDLGKIYAECKAQHEDSGQIDSLLVGERGGGAAQERVMICSSLNPSLERALDFAEIIRENWRMRIVYRTLVDIQGRCEQPGAMLKDVLPMLEGMVEYQREIEAAVHENSLKVLTGCIAEWMAVLNQPNTALKTGYGLLDYLTGGLHRKSLYVLAARPGKGKTDFALNLALRMSRSYRINYNTMEMARTECTQRIVSNVTRINEANIRDRRLRPEDYDNIAKTTQAISHASLALDEKVRITAADVKSKILRYQPDMIVLDSLQLMDKGRKGNQQEHEAVAQTTHMLKEIAMTYNVAILLLVQESREADKGGAPTMSGLYGGSAVEQDADAVLFIRNEAVKGKIVSGDDFIESRIHIVKNRKGGEGVCDFQYQPQYHRFTATDYEHSDGFTEVDDPDAPF